MALSGTTRSFGHWQRQSRHPKWGVRNFKPIEMAEIDLDRLTVLTGANSSGKSSLIQSLLLLAQSAGEGQVTLNGSLVTLGDGQDVIRLGQKSMTLELQIQVPAFLTDEGEVQLELSVDLIAARGELQVVGLVLRLDGTHLFDAKSDARTIKSLLAWQGLRSTHHESLLKIGPIEGVAQHAASVVELNGFIPETLYIRKSLAQRRRELRMQLLSPERRGRSYDRELLLFLSRMSPDDMSPIIHSLRNQLAHGRGFDRFESLLGESQEGQLEEFIEYLLRSSFGEWDAEPLTRRAIARPLSPGTGEALNDRDLRTIEAVYYLSHCAQGLSELASSIRYLGPLRDEPRVVYPMGRGSRHLPVGSHGEFTADFLAGRRSRNTSYITSDGRQTSSPLPDAVSEWIAYLGIGSGISVADRGKLGRTIRLTLQGTERDLTTVGVGASQLLPVVVAVLGAESGTLVLLEQPELHLHPAVQARLADFISTSRPDIRLIVETHSEALINRLRLRVVEGVLEPDLLSILFGEQTGGVTSFRHLKLNDYGDLSEWPRGFFEEGDQDSVKIVRLLAERLEQGDLLHSD